MYRYLKDLTKLVEGFPHSSNPVNNRTLAGLRSWREILASDYCSNMREHRWSSPLDFIRERYDDEYFENISTLNTAARFDRFLRRR